MATKDNDKGLYMPLRIDLSVWEQSLAVAGADLDKAMREMKAANGDLTLRYNVDIATAKAAGDKAKVVRLENEKLNALLHYQKQELQALTRAYQQTVKAQGQSSDAAQKLARNLVEQSRAIDRTQQQLDKAGLHLGKRISDSLASFSPQFAAAREATAGITDALQNMGGIATRIAKPLGAIGVAVAGLGAAYTVVNKAATQWKNYAQAAAEASEEVYQLREELNSTYETAELLTGAARIDGVSITSLNGQMNQLYKNLSLNQEEGKRAAAAMREFGVSITNADGSRKNAIEAFKSLQQGLLNAESVGKGRDFMTALFGGSSDQFYHFIRGFDGYLSRAKEAYAGNKKLYDISHDTLDLQKQAKEMERQLAAVRGDAYAEHYNEWQRVHNAGLAEQTELYKKSREEMVKYSKEMRNVSLAQEGLNLSWEKAKIAASTKFTGLLAEGWDLAKDAAAGYEKYISRFNPLKFMPGAIGVEALSKIVNSIAGSEKEIDAREQQQKLEAAMRKEQEAVAEQARKQKQEARSKAEAERKATETRLAAMEKFNKELRDLRSTDYEREINQLNDKVEQWRKAEIDEVSIAERVALEKEAIDKKYAEKAKQILDKQTKDTESSYQKQVEAAKRAREQAISEAEGLTRNNTKVLRFIAKQQQAGNPNWQAEAQAYADRLYMKQSGIRRADVSTLESVGVQAFKQIIDSAGRVFSNFAAPQQQQPVVNNNSNTTVNIDRPVLTDENLVNQLTSKILDKIVPAIQKPVTNNTL